MRVGPDTMVVVHYSLVVQDGVTPPELMRSFTARFVFGRDRVVPVLEGALAGHEPEDEIEVTIPPEHAFGDYDPGLVNQVPIESLRTKDRPRAGEFYDGPTADGRRIRFSVREVHDDYVVADFNHPAAGKALLLKAKIAEVRAASLADLLAAEGCTGKRGGG